jgi:PAS domain S-box-containing protein
MNTERNLLFGVVALQADLIDVSQFIEACLLWTTRKNECLADLLLGRGWIEAADKAHVEYLLERKLRKYGGDAHASLAAVPNEIKRSLAALDDDDIERSLSGEAPSAKSPLTTIDHVPAQVERYRRLHLHATGGIGRVWLARDADLGRDVALKELRPERAENATLGSRFLQEAQITGQLEHPGIIPVYELVRARDGRQPFYTMRFVRGRTLSAAAREYHDKRSAGQADALGLLALLNAFVTVCNTVAYAHSRGVIHRDLKGQNVIIGDFGEVVVLDWGLAKLVGGPEAGADAPAVVLDEVGADSGHTVPGQALGTPAYMAPEQAAGRLDLINQRTDVYGLGAILYEILTGSPPFAGDTTEEVLRRVREEDPAPPWQIWPEVPPALGALCQRALAKQSANRPEAAVDLALAVQGWQEFERRKAEEALRDSEALYQSLVESLPCFVVRKDLEGRFTFANRRLCEMLGCPLDQLVGKTDFSFFPEELAEKYCRGDEQVIASGQMLDVVEEHVAPNGEKLYVQVMKTPLYGPDGKVIGIQGIFWDVTARKRAEEALRKSRERFELAVQGSQDGLWDWDLEANQVWWSPRLGEMLGYDEQEFPMLPGEPKGVHPEDHDRWRAAVQGHIEGLTDQFELEYRMRHKDGSYRWVRARGVALRDANGKAHRVAGSLEDITRRKQSEAELAHERYLLHTLMDNLPDAIYFKDTASRFIRVNKAVAVLLGLDDPTQVVGKTHFDFFPEEDARSNTADDLEIMRTGRALVGEDEKITWPGGREGWLSTTKMPLRDQDGTIIGTFGVSRDITQRKQLEIALRQSEERYRSVIAAMHDASSCSTPTAAPAPAMTARMIDEREPTAQGR